MPRWPTLASRGRRPAKRALPPDGCEVEVILFDLDNTLYHPDCGLQEAGDRLITRFISGRLGVTWDEADRIRVRTWRQYGATARGLQVEFGIPQREFLSLSIERVPIERYVEPDPALEAMLRSLPQRLYVFTNATRSYAERTLAALGVAEHFEEIFDIGFANGRPKPHCDCYRRIIETVGVEPRRVALIEDTEANLEPAGQMGMVTVKVGPPPPEGHHLYVSDLLALPDLLGA